MQNVKHMMNLSEKALEQIRHQFKNSDPDSKVNFQEFLAVLQKESLYRETLIEAQMFRQSPYRLQYGKELPLITA